MDREVTPEDVLLQQRRVLLSGTLDEQAAGDAAAKLMTLDASGDDHVELLISADGTSLDAAFTLMDVVELLGVPVHVTCMGRLEGPAVGVLAVGAPGHRRIAPHARIRLHDPDFEARGPAAQMDAWLHHHQDALRRFHLRMAEATGNPIAAVEADFGRGRFLTAEEAVAYGLADGMATPGRA